MLEPRLGIRHPLSWFGFYGECFRYAFSGAWGLAGGASFAAGLILPLWNAMKPASYASFVAFLSTHYLSAEALRWKVPLFVGVGMLVCRLITAPFLVYRNKPDRSTSSPSEIKRRAALLAAEITQFVTQRRATDPIIVWRMADHVPENLSGQSIAHRHQTDSLYFELFAERIETLREECALIDLTDAELDDIHLHPAGLPGIEKIAERITALAERIPTSAVVH